MANDVNIAVNLTGLAGVRSGLAQLQAGLAKFAQSTNALGGSTGLATLTAGFQKFNQVANQTAGGRSGLTALRSGFLQLNQAVTAPTRGLAGLAAGFQTLQANGRAAIATNANLATAHARLAGVTNNYATTVQRLGAAHHQAARGGLALGTALSRTNAGVLSLQRSISSTARTLTGFKTIFVATLSVGAGLTLIGLADKFTLLNAKLAIVTKSSIEQSRALQTVFDIAQRTRTPLQAVGTTYQRLALAGENLGLTQQQVADITETLGKALQVSGATASEAAGGMIQLTQAMSKGKLDGDELRSVFENMPPVVRALELSMGKTRGELYKMASQGKITGAALANAILQAKTAIDKQFAEIPRTVGQVATQVANQWAFTFGKIASDTQGMRGLIEVLDELRNIIASPEFAAGVASILTGFTNMASGAASLITRIDELSAKFGAFLDKMTVIALDPNFLNWGPKFDEIDARLAKSLVSIGKMRPAFAANTEIIASLTERLGVLEKQLEDLQKPAAGGRGGFIRPEQIAAIETAQREIAELKTAIDTIKPVNLAGIGKTNMQEASAGLFAEIEQSARDTTFGLTKTFADAGSAVVMSMTEDMVVVAGKIQALAAVAKETATGVKSSFGSMFIGLEFLSDFGAFHQAGAAVDDFNNRLKPVPENAAAATSKIKSMSEQMRSWVDHAIASGTASERFATGAAMLKGELDRGSITLERYNELMRELRMETDMMNFGDRAAAEAKSAVDAYQSIIPPLQLYAATLAEIKARQIETGMAGAEVAKLQGMAFAELASTTLGAAGAMTGALAQLFEGNKAFAIANVVVHTAEAIAAALKNPPGPPFSYVYAAAAAATGAAQIAAIQSASPGSATVPSVSSGGGGKKSASAGSNPTGSSGGHRGRQRGGSIGGYGSGDIVPMMLEPGEFVVNRNAARSHRQLLASINAAVPRFGGGGGDGMQGGGTVIVKKIAGMRNGGAVDDDGISQLVNGNAPVFVMNFEREFIAEDNRLGSFARKTSNMFSKEYKRRFGKRPF